MQEVTTIWQQVLEKLELRVSSVSFMLWIKTIKPLEIDDKDNFIIVAQSVSAKNQILRNFLDKIGDCCFEVVGKPLKIVVLDQNEEIEYMKNNNVEEKSVSAVEEKNPFIEEFTFDRQQLQPTFHLWKFWTWQNSPYARDWKLYSKTQSTT